MGYSYNLFRIQDPGVKKAPDPGSESATLVIFIVLKSLMMMPIFFFLLYFYLLFMCVLVSSVLPDPVLWSRSHRILEFLGLLDPDPSLFVRIWMLPSIEQKKRNFDSTVL
jgi:hypothetical protein